MYGSTDLGERKQLLLPLMLEREGRGDEHRVRLPPVDVHALAAPLSNIGWRGKWGVTGGGGNTVGEGWWRGVMTSLGSRRRPNMAVSI